jgi:hypothetical protein
MVGDLQLVRGEQQSDTPQDRLIAVFQVTEESHRGVERRDYYHSGVEDAGPAAEVLRRLHVVLQRQNLKKTVRQVQTRDRSNSPRRFLRRRKSPCRSRAVIATKWKTP